MYDFDTVVDRLNTCCYKWDSMTDEQKRIGAIPLGLADMDFAVMPSIRDAIKKKCSGMPVFGYDFPEESYYSAIIDWTRRRNGLVLSKDNIMDVPGVLIALSAAIEAMSREGEKVLINPPVYHLFEKSIQRLNRIPVYSPLACRDGQYVLDFEDMEKKMREGVSVYLLCSPHNPVGRVWTAEELRRVCALCEKYGVRLVVDEIHCDVVYPGYRHCSVFNVFPSSKAFAVSVTSPSKTFNIAGLKTANLFVFDPDIQKAIDTELDRRFIEVNTLGTVAAEAAYRNGDVWVEELVRYVKGNAQFAVDSFQNRLPAIKAYIPEATFLLWLDCRGLGLSQQVLMDRFNACGALVSNGETFGEGGTGFVRMNIGTSRKTLENALERIIGAFH